MPSLRGLRAKPLDPGKQFGADPLHGFLKASELGKQPVPEDGEDDQRDAADGKPDDQDDHGGDLTAPEF
jgi:hypothetical protein